MARGGFLLVGTFLFVTSIPLAHAHDAPARDYIVVLDDRVAAEVAHLHAERFGLEIRHIYRHALSGYSATMTPATARLLAAAPAVRWVQRDRRVRIAGQTLPTGVNRVDADVNATASIDGVDGRVDADIAVLDTGWTLITRI